MTGAEGVRAELREADLSADRRIVVADDRGRIVRIKDGAGVTLIDRAEILDREDAFESRTPDV